MDHYAEAARDFLRRALDHSGLSPQRLAELAGVSATTITRPLNNPNFKFTPKQATLDKIARAAGLPSPTGVTPPEPTIFSDLRSIPILGSVQAGAWREVGVSVAVPDGYIQLALPEYENADLGALRVVGRSMDLFYPEGSLIVFAKAADTGVRVGDHVVVQRSRGGFVETTLKELATEDGELVLLPRSSDATIPPIRYRPDRDEAQQEGVEIIGVVVAQYMRRAPSTGPILRL